MNQFFSNCKFIYYLLRDTFKHFINKIKKIKKIILINDNVELSKTDIFFLNRPNLLYYLIKLEKIIPVNITKLETRVDNFYCHFKNNHGEVKKIFNNTKLKDILTEANKININNKTDGTFDNNVILEIKLYNTISMFNLDIKNYLLNIDSNTTINLKDLLRYENISTDLYNRIEIKYLNITTFDEHVIDTSITDYLTKNIAELL